MYATCVSSLSIRIGVNTKIHLASDAQICRCDFFVTDATVVDCLLTLLMLRTLLRFLQTVKIKRSDYLCNFSEFDFTGYSLACTGI